MKKLESNSREEWLEQRKQFLTATDIAKIITGGPAAWAEVKKSKQEGSKSIPVTEAMKFGNEREKHIAEFVQVFADPTGLLKPNDQLWVSDDNPRLAATPDMVGINADGVCEVIGELKTTKHDWAETPRNYWVQVQTQLYVTKAKYCVFAWEVHVDYVPVKKDWVIIYPDLEFFAMIEATEKRFSAPEEEQSEWDLLLLEYADAKRGLDAAETRLEKVKAEIIAASRDEDQLFKSELGSITYKHGTVNRLQEKKLLEAHPEFMAEFSKFDAAAFKRANKELAAQFTTKGKTKDRVLRVTLPKEEKK